LVSRSTAIAAITNNRPEKHEYAKMEAARAEVRPRDTRGTDPGGRATVWPTRCGVHWSGCRSIRPLRLTAVHGRTEGPAECTSGDLP
jgi:hypothetical protein